MYRLPPQFVRINEWKSKFHSSSHELVRSKQLILNLRTVLWSNDRVSNVQMFQDLVQPCDRSRNSYAQLMASNTYEISGKVRGLLHETMPLSTGSTCAEICERLHTDVWIGPNGCSSTMIAKTLKSRPITLQDAGPRLRWYVRNQCDARTVIKERH